VALSIADRGYVMETGHIVCSGSESNSATILKSDAPIAGFEASRKDRRLFDAISGRETCSWVSNPLEPVELPVLPQEAEIECAMTDKDAINRLQCLQANYGGANLHAEANVVLCDFLDAIGYGKVAHEFRKIYEMYPTVTPKYSRRF
jgi:hypothetical protein